MTSPANKHSITVPASTQNLADVRQFVAQHAQKFGFAKESIADIRLAVDEAFTNIIHHAYKDDDRQSVKISLCNTDDVFGVSLFDTGQSFSLEQYHQPDVKEKIKQKKRGGVGVYLIKELMDDVNYLHEGTRNEIRMTKKR